MRREYDFRGGVRGKYAARMEKGSNIVMLDCDVRELFPNSAAVNAALRVLAQIVAVVDATRAARTRSRRRNIATERERNDE
jgi:hypothetical protein